MTSAAANKYFLVADTRERSIIPFLTDVEYDIKQISYGDYLIMTRGPYSNTVAACFERKTWADFAASLKDGRHGNFDKLRQLRASTGCDLYLIVEGSAFPAPSTKFGGIEHYKIQAAITHLMVIDKIQIIHSENQQNTAARLTEIIGVYNKIPVQTKEQQICYHTDQIRRICTETPPAICDVHAAGETFEIATELTTPVVKANSAIAIDMWATLGGISHITAKALIMKLSIHDVVTGKYSAAEIQSLKTLHGKKFSTSVYASLCAVICGSKPHIIKMLAEIPQITEQSAASLVSKFDDIKALFNASVDELSAIVIDQKTRKIKFGAARAAKLYELIRYCELPAP
jgi:ERCC4-type nuclease